jgi:endonuclease/exonuclease/phosphatase family metal-dependent hydrolase
MKVNGIALHDFQIVYPENSDGGYEKFLAQQLANGLEAAWGFSAVLRSDREAPSAHEILVGNTNRDTSGYAGELGFDDFSVSSDGTHVVLTSKVYKGLGEAVNKFLELVRGGEEVSIPLNNIMPCKTYSAMSRNILYIYHEERWPTVVDLILKYMPDSVGLQEPERHWNAFLLENDKLREHYNVIIYPFRDGRSGTNEIILTRKDKYRIKKIATKWLSDTPDEISKFEEAKLHRIVNFAKLKDKQTGSCITHVNTHLDHLQEAARAKQARVLLNCVKEFGDETYIITGDFNTTRDCDNNPLAYPMMVTGTGLADSRDIAAYGTQRNTIPSDDPRVIIDYCFVSEAAVKVNYYHVCAEKMPAQDGSMIYPSDHCAVYIAYELK